MPRPVGFSRQKAPITPTKSINNSAQLCAEFEPAPQCARLTLSALTRQGKHPDELLAKTTKSCSLEINAHAFNHGQQKNVEKVSQTLHILLFYLFPAVVFRLPRQLDRRPRGSKEPSRFSQTAALQTCQQVKIASE